MWSQRWINMCSPKQPVQQTLSKGKDKAGYLE